MFVSRSRRWISIALTVMLTGGYGELVFSNPPRSIDEKLLDADFVFRGVVTKVQYRYSSAENAGAANIPYTFVTYRVHSILKGNYSQSLATLRFMGGPGKEPGTVMMTGGQPLFDVGDQDILLVRGNNVFPCPLVDCREGRFRYVGGVVVNEVGQRILLNADGSLARGEPIDSEDIAVNQMGNMKIERREINETNASEKAATFDTPSNATVPDLESFSSHLKQTIQKTHTPEQLSGLLPFQNADPDKPFVDPTSRDNSLEPPSSVPGRVISEEERRELELEKQRLLGRQAVTQASEFRRVQRELNQGMEKKYSKFYPGTESSVQENENALVETTASGRWIWLAIILIMPIAGWILWRQYRLRRHRPIS